MEGSPRPPASSQDRQVAQWWGQLQMPSCPGLFWLLSIVTAPLSLLLPPLAPPPSPEPCSLLLCGPLPFVSSSQGLCLLYVPLTCSPLLRGRKKDRVRGLEQLPPSCTQILLVASISEKLPPLLS